MTEMDAGRPPSAKKLCGITTGKEELGRVSSEVSARAIRTGTYSGQ